MNPLIKKFALFALLGCVVFGGTMAFMRSTTPALPASEHNHTSAFDHSKCATMIVDRPLPALNLQTTNQAFVDAIEISKQKPVIMIRYLGYGCSHCVEQLTAINALADSLKQYGIPVLAFSSDAPEDNILMLKAMKYDTSVMSVLSDYSDNSAKKLGGQFREENGTTTQLHIAMIVRNGIVRFANFDTKPFMDAPYLLARAKGLL
jgi:thioredoxin-dependent peroxiredoxin